MRTISQYREDIKILMDKVADMNATAINANRDLSDAEIDAKNSMMDKVEEYRKQVATLEREAQLSESLNTPESPSSVIKNSRFEMVQSKKDRFQSLGEQMAAIMRAGSPGGTVDPRLYNAATGMNETVSSDGGFLVQQDFSTELLKEVYQTGVLASRCRRIQISGNSNGIKIPGVDETSRASTRSGGVLAYWKDEAAAKTASRPTFRMIELNLNKLIGLCYATDELLSDVTALEGYIKQAFVNEFGFQIDDAIINGSGAGMPLGVLNSGCLVSVAAETGQDSGTILAENVIKMYSRIFASSRQNAAWYINQNVEPQLFKMSLAVGTSGVPVYMPAGGLSAQPYGTLFGRPVIPIEQAASIGTVGDIIFGDLSNGYILAEKGGIQQDMSIHVQFQYDESVFRFVLRISGQPVRATPLTPYKGGANYTQSHFVALETRS